MADSARLSAWILRYIHPTHFLLCLGKDFRDGFAEAFRLRRVVKQARRRSTQLRFLRAQSAPCSSLPSGALRAGCDRRLDGLLQPLPMKPRNGPRRTWRITLMARQPSLLVRKPSHRLYRVLGDGEGAMDAHRCGVAEL